MSLKSSSIFQIVFDCRIERHHHLRTTEGTSCSSKTFSELPQNNKA